MVSARETLTLVVNADVSGAIKELDKVGSKSEQELKRSTNAVDRWGSRLQMGGAAAVGFAAVAGRALIAAGQSASNLSESLNKSNVIFGSAARSVETFADSAAKSMGQSKRAALDAATTFGGLFTNIGKTDAEAAAMSMTMVKLAGDLASFGNSTPEEAVLALGSALRGENEPIRQFNVLLDDATLKQRALSMGLIESATQTLPPAVKAQAAYAEILEQTSAAQGDFARTSDGAANRQRILVAEFENLKASIGEGVLPVMNSALGGLNSLIGAFESLPDGARSTAGGIAAFGTAAAGTLGSVSFLAGSVMKMRDRFLAVPAEGLAGGLNNFGKAAGIAGLAAGGLSAAFALLKMDSDRAAADVRNLTDAVRQNGTTLGQEAGNKLADYIAKHEGMQRTMRGAGISVEQLSAAIQGNGDAYRQVNAALEDYEHANMQGSSLLPRVQQELNGVRGALESQRTAFKDARSEIDASNKATKDLSQTNLDGTKATAALGQATDDAADSQKSMADKVEEANKKLLDQIALVTGAPGAQRAYEAAVRDAESAQNDLAEKTKIANTTIGKEHAEAVIAQQDADDKAKDSIDRVAEAAVVAAQKNAELNGGHLDAAQSAAVQRDALEKLKEKISDPALRAYIDTLIGQLDTLAKNRSGSLKYNMEVTANGQFVDPATAKALAREFSGGSFGINVDRKAAGGPVKSGTPYFVGEEGPELFVPKQDGTIVPNDALRNSRPMGSPMGQQSTGMAGTAAPQVNVHQTIYALDPYTAAREASRDVAWAIKTARY